MKKRVLSLILVIAMLLTLVPADMTAKAQTTPYIGWSMLNGDGTPGVIKNGYDNSKGSVTDIWMYFVDEQEAYHSLTLDQLTIEQNPDAPDTEVIRLTQANNNALHVEMLGWGTATVKYTHTDNTVYTMNVVSDIRDYGYYTSATASRETYITEYTVTGTVDNVEGEFYFAAKNSGDTVNDWQATTGLLEIADVEPSQDGTYYKITVKKEPVGGVDYGFNRILNDANVGNDYITLYDGVDNGNGNIGVGGDSGEGGGTGDGSGEDSGNDSAYMEGFKDHGYRVFDDEDLTLWLDTTIDPITSLTWTVGFDVYDPNTCFTEGVEYTVDGSNIILHGDKIAAIKPDESEWAFTVRVDINGNDGPSLEHTVFLTKTMRDYDYMEDRTVLAGDSVHVQDMMNVRFIDKDHRDEQNQPVRVIGVEIVEQTDAFGASASGIFEVESTDIYRVIAHEAGSATVRVTHETIDGGTDHYDFVVGAIEEVYELNWSMSGGNSNLLPGESMEIDTSVHKRTAVKNQDGYWEHHGEEIEGYTLTAEKSGDAAIDLAVNGKCLTVTAKEDAQYEEQMFAIVVTGDFGTIRSDAGVCITNSYYALEYEHIDCDVKLGGTLDLSGLRLMRYYLDANGKQTSESVANPEWNISYSDHSWEVVTEADLPVLKRISTGGTQIHVWVGFSNENNDYESMECQLEIHELNYNIDLERKDNFFTNETMELMLEASSLSDKDDYTLFVQVGTRENDEIQHVGDEAFDFVLDDEGTPVAIHLYGDVIGEVLRQIHGDWDRMPVELSIEVRVDGQTMARAEHGMELIYAGCRYDKWEDQVMLMHDGMDIENWMRAHVQNRDHMDEPGFDVVVHGVEVEVLDGASDAVVVVAREDGQGWRLETKSAGYAKVTVTHDDAEDISKTTSYDFYITVQEEIWNVQMIVDGDGYFVLPGEEVAISAEVVRHWVDGQTGEIVEGDTSQSMICWEYPTVNGVTFTETNGQLQMSVAMNTELGRVFDVVVYVVPVDENGDMMTDDNGDPIVYAAESHSFHLTEGYYTIRPDGLGDPFEWNTTKTVTPELVLISNDTNGQMQETVITASVHFAIHYMMEEFVVTDDNDAIIMPGEIVAYGTPLTIKRIGVQQQEILLDAYVIDDYGNQQGVTSGMWTIQWIPLAEVIVDGQGGDFYFGPEDEYREWPDVNLELPVNGTLEGAGFQLSDPVFFDSQRSFLGWTVHTRKEVTNESGEIVMDWVALPQRMTTNQVLQMEIPEEGMLIRAAWAGDDYDYGSDVAFDPYGGTVVLMDRSMGERQVLTEAEGGFFWSNGRMLADVLDAYISDDPAEDLKPYHDFYHYEGWLQYKITEDGLVLVSDTIYTSDEVFQMSVPEYNVMFRVKWQELSLEDYGWSVTADVPEVDPSEPVQEVTVGVSEEKAEEMEQMLKDTSHDIVENVAAGKAEDNAVSDHVQKAIADAIRDEKYMEVSTGVVVTPLDDSHRDDPEYQEDMEMILDAVDEEDTTLHFMDLDVTITVKVEGEVPLSGNITALEEPIVFMLVLPEEMKEDMANVPAGKELKVYVLYVHEGELKVIEDVKLRDDGNVEFPADEFSTYALAYEFVDKQVTPAPQPTPQSPAPTQKPAQNAPTGDNAPVMLYAILIMVSAMAMVAVERKKRTVRR